MNDETHQFVQYKTVTNSNRQCVLCGESDEHPNHGKPTSVSPSTAPEVKRYGLTEYKDCYRLDHEMSEWPAGDYVLFSDYTSLSAQLEKVKQENERLTENVNQLAFELGCTEKESHRHSHGRCLVTGVVKLEKRAESAESRLVATREALLRLVAAANDVVERTNAPNNIPVNNLKHYMNEATKTLKALAALGDKGDTNDNTQT